MSEKITSFLFAKGARPRRFYGSLTAIAQKVENRAARDRSDEFVVTAGKRDKPLQIYAGAANADQLSATGIANPQDIRNHVPNVSIDRRPAMRCCAS